MRREPLIQVAETVGRSTHRKELGSFEQAVGTRSLDVLLEGQGVSDAECPELSIEGLLVRYEVLAKDFAAYSDGSFSSLERQLFQYERVCAHKYAM